MLGRLQVRSCSKLGRLVCRRTFMTTFVGFPYVLPQKATFMRTMSSTEENVPQCPGDSAHGSSSKNLSSRQKLSLVFAEYGVTAVVFHTAISLTSLGLCYAAVSSGLDVPGFLIKIGISESASQSMVAKGASTFVISYACHKVFMPLRILMTVTCTPIIVHRLRRLGLIK